MKKNTIYIFFFLLVYGGVYAQDTAGLFSETIGGQSVLPASENGSAKESNWGNIYTQNGKIFVYAPVKMDLIEVYDLNGCLHVVKERMDAASAQIPFSREGIYLVKITAQDGEVFSRKIKI